MKGNKSNLYYKYFKINQWRKWDPCLKATYKRKPTPMGENMGWKHFKMCVVFVHSSCPVGFLFGNTHLLVTCWSSILWHKKGCGQRRALQPGSEDSSCPFLAGHLLGTQLPSGLVILLLLIRKLFIPPRHKLQD